MTARTGLREKILAALADKQPHSGPDLAAKIKEDSGAVSMALWAMVGLGKAAKRTEGRTHLYFYDEAAAAACPDDVFYIAVQHAAAERTARQQESFKRAGHKRKSLPRKQMPAPAGMPVGPRFTAGPSGIKEQPAEPVGQPTQRGIAAGYDPRYQCDPNTRIVGGFATLGIGRYLPA